MTMTHESFIDDAGQVHRRFDSSARIISLVPSLTELLFDLGLGESVVGRTDYCCHPAAAIDNVVSVGGTKRVNWPVLTALAPSHVIVNVDETPRPVFEWLIASGYAVIVTHPVSVEDNARLFHLLGGIFGRQREAASLCHSFSSVLADVSMAARSLPRRRVLYLIWRKPWMTVARDTYVSRLLAQINWLTEPAAVSTRV
ncbi:MAG: ABC transporter substrate-binding protein, partial [Rhodospirillales bacterium]|nr:ABC transporter substrate-binding protein [Rhodospirillales bacterium]